MLLQELSNYHFEQNEKIILREFLTWDNRSIEELIKALYGHKSDGGPEDAKNTISVYRFRINKKLKNNWKIRKIRDCIYILCDAPVYKKQAKKEKIQKKKGKIYDFKKSMRGRTFNL